MRTNIFPVLLLVCLAGKAQEKTASVNKQPVTVFETSLIEYSPTELTTVTNHKGRKLNFFIISKPKKFWDPGTYFNIVRAKIKSLLRPTRFVCIVASSSEQMASKMKFRIRKYNAQIGNIWFDSHGSLKKGYSFFTIGKDEFSYKNIKDSNHVKAFLELSDYCDSNTHIGIGSCYGGATYRRPETGNFKESPMNGDSLIIGLGKIFKGTTIYGCESWVMTKPGLFKETFAMAGYPLLRRYKDVVYTPVWEQLGVWNSYSTRFSTLQRVNCIKLDKEGNIGTRFNHYQSQKKVKKQLARILSRLQEGVLKI
jgi:hypothetical protein